MEFKIDITEVTWTVFGVVLTSAVLNLALFLLGAAAITGQTFLGSMFLIGLLQWLLYSAVQAINLQFEIREAPSEESLENPEDGKNEQ